MKRTVIFSIAAIVLLLASAVFLKTRYASPRSSNSTDGTHAPKVEGAGVSRGNGPSKEEPKMGTPEWLTWYRELSAGERRAWAIAKDELVTPAEPSEKQIGQITVRALGESKAGPFKGWMLENYKPLLRVPRGVGVRPLQTKTVRGRDGLITTLWARRAKGSAVVDWKGKGVIKGEIDSAKAGTSPVPQIVPFENFLTSSPTRGLLFYKNGQKSFRTKIDRKKNIFPLALDEEFEYAFGLVRNDSKVPAVVDEIVIVDVAQKKIAGFVSIPPAPMSVHVVFDTKTKYLLVVESEWKWILLLDLLKPDSDSNND